MMYVMQEMVESLKRAKMELLIAICWGAWHARNLFIFETKQVDPLNALAKAEVIIESYRRFKIPSSNHLVTKEDSNQPHWCPPPKGFVNINVDAATNVGEQAAGLGVVVRDCNGSYVAATVKTVQFFGDVQQSEAKAIAWGIQVAKQTGNLSVIIETDSQRVADLVNKKDSRTPICWVISEIQELSKECIEWKVKFTLRTCNTKAHRLAKLALEFVKPAIWVDLFPANVLCIL